MSHLVTVQFFFCIRGSRWGQNSASWWQVYPNQDTANANPKDAQKICAIVLGHLRHPLSFGLVSFAI